MSEPRRPYGWDDYLYPPNAMGVQVLRNKLDIRSIGEWFNAQRALTFGRERELAAYPGLVPRTFDSAH